MNSLTLSHISKSFQSRVVVDDLSLSVESGKIQALIGPNGAGKTTSIHMILGLLKPDGGRIEIFGKSQYRMVRDRVGYLPEQRGLYLEEKLEDCLRYFLALKGVSRRDREKQLGPWMERFGLQSHRNKRLSQLSKGMQRKAQFIVALAHNPDLLILDEPFSGLDVASIALAKQVMREQAASGKTILMSTHEMYLVEELADSVLLLNQGKVCLDGAPASIRREFGAAHSFRFHGHGFLPENIPQAQIVKGQRDGEYLLELHQGSTLNQALAEITNLGGYQIERVLPNLPTLEEIFLRLVHP